MVTTFLAVGRQGDVACSSWNSMTWDYDLQNVTMDWKEVKNGDADQTNFFSDASKKQPLISKYPRRIRLIPDLARSHDTAASVMTKFFRSAIESSNDLCLSSHAKDYEGTSLRYMHNWTSNACNSTTCTAMLKLSYT